MHWLGIVLIGSGCSLLLEENSTSDASIVDGSSEDVSSTDAFINTTDPSLPYTCDADTIALYHFDDRTNVGLEACGGGALEAVGMGATEAHAGFQNAVRIGDEAQTLKTMAAEIRLDSAFVVEAWVKAPPAGADNQRVYIASSNNDGATSGGRRFEFLLAARAGNWALRAEVADSSCQMYSLVEGGAINDNNWHHVVLNADGSGDASLTLTIDALDVGEQTESLPGVCGTGQPAHVFIGGSDRDSGEIYGQAIDELRISKILRP